MRLKILFSKKENYTMPKLKTFRRARPLVEAVVDDNLPELEVRSDYQPLVSLAFKDKSGWERMTNIGKAGSSRAINPIECCLCIENSRGSTQVKCSQDHLICNVCLRRYALENFLQDRLKCVQPDCQGIYTISKDLHNEIMEMRPPHLRIERVVDQPVREIVNLGDIFAEADERRGEERRYAIEQRRRQHQERIAEIIEHQRQHEGRMAEIERQGRMAEIERQHEVRMAEIERQRLAEREREERRERQQRMLEELNAAIRNEQLEHHRQNHPRAQLQNVEQLVEHLPPPPTLPQELSISGRVSTPAMEDLNLRFEWDYSDSMDPIVIRRWVEDILTKYLSITCYDCNLTFFHADECNKVKCPRCSSKYCAECRSFITSYSHFGMRMADDGHFCKMYPSTERANILERRRLEKIIDLTKAHPNGKVVADVIVANFLPH